MFTVNSFRASVCGLFVTEHYGFTVDDSRCRIRHVLLETQGKS
jgi:hypothetical protein